LKSFPQSNRGFGDPAGEAKIGVASPNPFPAPPSVAARKRPQRLRLFSFLFNAVTDPKFHRYSFVLMKSGFLVRAELDIDLQLPPA
jgi:hypothetical protein